MFIFWVVEYSLSDQISLADLANWVKHTYKIYALCPEVMVGRGHSISSLDLGWHQPDCRQDAQDVE